MSEIDDDGTLTEAELAELERRRKEGRPSLDEEIVAKYEPDRLARMVVQGGGRGEHLDLSTRGEMERRLPGFDFNNVRVFRGALAEEVTRRHNADAVTIGNTGMILIRESGRAAPGTTSGTALLAHELTHVAQAQRGMQFAREGGGEGSHEHEAEHVEASVQHGGGTHVRDPIGNKVREEKRVEALHKEVVARVIELVAEEEWLFSVRNGEDR